MNSYQPRHLGGREQARSFRRRVGTSTARVWDLPRTGRRAARSFGEPTATAVRHGRLRSFRALVRHLAPRLDSPALWPLDDNRPYVIAKHKDDVKGLAFTPDGKGSSPAPTMAPCALVAAAWRGAERRLLVGRHDPGSARMAADPSLRPVRGGGARPHPPGAPRGRSATRAPGLRRGDRHPRPAFGDGGRLVAAAVRGLPRPVRVWNLETGAVQDPRPRRRLPDPGATVRSAAPGSSAGFPPGQRMTGPKRLAGSGIVALRFAARHRSCPGLGARTELSRSAAAGTLALGYTTCRPVGAL